MALMSRTSKVFGVIFCILGISYFFLVDDYGLEKNCNFLGYEEGRGIVEEYYCYNLSKTIHDDGTVSYTKIRSKGQLDLTTKDKLMFLLFWPLHLGLLIVSGVGFCVFLAEDES